MPGQTPGKCVRSESTSIDVLLGGVATWGGRGIADRVCGRSGLQDHDPLFIYERGNLLDDKAVSKGPLPTLLTRGRSPWSLGFTDWHPDWVAPGSTAAAVQDCPAVLVTTRLPTTPSTRCT